MKFCLRTVLLLLLVSGTLTQDFGLDLADALDDPVPTPAKPKEQPKAPEKPKTDGGFGLDLEDALGPDPKPDPKPDKPAVNPPKNGGGGFELDLEDALGPDPAPKPKPDKPAVKPPKSGGDGFDLEDALGPDPKPKPDKPAIKPPMNGGGRGNFDDSDLADVGGGDYKPDGGRAANPGHSPQDAGDQPQEAAVGPLAGIISAVGVALVGAASSYFAYQKKKLCFKIQGGADPESGKDHQGQSDPQVFSNLLNRS